MALLAKGNWPLLSDVKLSFSSTLDAIAIAHLSAASWIVEELKISDTMVTVDTAAELADLQLPNMMWLDLSECSLTAAAVSELARADWPILSYLSIGTTDDAVAVLLGLDLETVQELKSDPCVAQTVFLQRKVTWPDMGLWSNLRHISIHRDWIFIYI